MVQSVIGCIKTAKALGKHAGVFSSSPALLDACMQAGCDFAFVTIDIGDLAQAWTARRQELTKLFGNAK